jgi:hypothetical protein
VTSKQFVLRFVAAFTTLTAAIVALNIYVDFYGVFRGARGERLRIYGETRTFKYLFAKRYIPTNFDGLLIGSSMSETLRTGSIGKFRIYNLSLNGGNITEEKTLAYRAYEHKRFEITIFCIHRYLTKDSGQKTHLLDPEQDTSPLGSPSLLQAYGLSALAHAGFTRTYYDEFGTYVGAKEDPATASAALHETVRAIQRGAAGIEVYEIDPTARMELAELIKTAEARSNFVVAYYPPVPHDVLELTRERFLRYKQETSKLFSPQALLIDFNTDEYVDFRADTSNYRDGSHLSTKGNTFVAQQLHDHIDHYLAARPWKLEVAH